MINDKISFTKIMLGLVLLLSVSACEDTPPLPDNLINFETDVIGIEDATGEITVTLSRAEKEDISVELSMITNMVAYETEFTTDPVATANHLTLVIPAGETQGVITVSKQEGIFFDGDESVQFIIESISGDLVLGETPVITVNFSAILSTGSTLTLQGKTDASAYANVVYVDLSANAQTPVDRKSWALGFESGDQFRVILNGSFQMLAAKVDKTDINSVTVTDGEASKIYNFDPFTPDPTALTLVDNWNGSLDDTAIDPVSATDADNKVFLIATGNAALNNPTTWYKIRVLRNGNGYTLQYAKVGATTFTSVNVSKSDTHNFTFVSLDNGADGTVVSAEPVKTNWDIQWCYGTYNSGLNTPYWVQDLVMINNVRGARAGQVLTSIVSYDDFSETNIANVTFESTRDAIGSKWRSTMAGTLSTDRFYVIEDSFGNVYKLKFVSFHPNHAGVRGNPVIQYALVKAAD